MADRLAPAAPIDALRQDAARFAFDAAVRVLLHRAGTPEPMTAVRFDSPPHLAYPGAEILALTEDGSELPRLATSVIGLTGPAGALPRPYTELVTVATRERSPSLKAFLDMMAERFVATYALAGRKYRLALLSETAALAGAPSAIGSVLLALTGHGHAGMAARLGMGEAALQHYAGFFAMRPRSAERLAALASDWLGRPVHVRQFVGVWLAIPESEQTRLAHGQAAGAFARLGVDAVAGVRAWDMQSRIVLSVGPLSLPAFQALLPERPALRRFVALLRTFLDLEIDFALNLVLQREAVPPLLLAGDAEPAPRLGWNSWLTAPVGARLRDADEPLFEAAVLLAA